MILSLMKRPTPTSTMLSRNGTASPRTRAATPWPRGRPGWRAETRRDAHLRPAPEETSPALRGVLDRHQDGAAPLAAHPDALAEAQHDEQYRGQYAHALEGGHNPIRACDTHDQERQNQHRLAPDLVPVVPKTMPPAAAAKPTA